MTNKVEANQGAPQVSVCLKHYVVVEGTNKRELRTTNSAIAAFLYLAKASFSRGPPREIRFEIVTKVKVFKGSIVRGKGKWHGTRVNQARPRTEGMLNRQAVNIMRERAPTPLIAPLTREAIQAEEAIIAASPAVQPDVVDKSANAGDIQAKEEDVASTLDVQPTYSEGIQVEKESVENSEDINKESIEEVKTGVPKKWIALDEWIKALEDSRTPESELGSLRLLEGKDESKKKVSKLLNDIKGLNDFPKLFNLAKEEREKIIESLKTFNVEELEFLLSNITKIGNSNFPNFHIKLQYVIINCLSEIYPEIKESIAESWSDSGYVLILTIRFFYGRR